MSQIIFLHGASSSGKTTLARALQARIETPFWHISIDHLRDAGVLPSARFASGEFDWRAHRATFFAAFHASLGAYADAGADLIVEHILDTQGWLEDLRQAWRGHDVLFTALHCPLPLLTAREAARGDRPFGSAEADFHSIHKGLNYDLELNSEDDLQANIARLLTAWRAPARRSSFAPHAPS